MADVITTQLLIVNEVPRVLQQTPYFDLGLHFIPGKSDANAPTQTNDSAGVPLLVAPVIFTDEFEDSQVLKEEIFGPVVVINTFETEDEVIAKANDTEFGLYAALYTKDLERALRMSTKLESGMIGVNRPSPTGCWDLPFGGWKSSGLGRESLLESLAEYMEVMSAYIRCARP